LFNDEADVYLKTSIDEVMCFLKIKFLITKTAKTDDRNHFQSNFSQDWSVGLLKQANY